MSSRSEMRHGRSVRAAALAAIFALLAWHTVAIRQASLVTSYNPYGYVGHAFGPVDGYTVTNSLEAFESNYARGFRVFEVDMVRLADGAVFIAHNQEEDKYGLAESHRDLTRPEVESRKWMGKYTSMFSQQLLQLMQQYPDITIIADTKREHVDIYRTLMAQAPNDDVRHRLIPHIAGQTDLDLYREIFPMESYVLALYRTQWRNSFDDSEVLDFVRRNKVPAVMMWWRDRDWSLSLEENSHENRRFTPEFAEGLQDAGRPSTSTA